MVDVECPVIHTISLTSSIQEYYFLERAYNMDGVIDGF